MNKLKILTGMILGLVAAVAVADVTIREVEDRAESGETEAIAALRDSAANGSLRAMNFLGYLYWQGKGTRLDPDSALYFLRTAAAGGDAKAAANLGHLLLTGAPQLEADTTQALQLLNFAASKYAPSAIRELADYYDSHPADSLSAPSLKIIADAYSHGRILRYNYRKSIEYYNRAAELGDTASKRIIAELLEFFPDILPEE